MSHRATRHVTLENLTQESKLRDKVAKCDITLSSHVDLHIQAGSAFDNRVTLAFDLLTSF